jgi:dTDP-4-dehydrorhamnose 3,5-epimerase
MQLLHATPIPGCYRVTPHRADDRRGSFFKPFSESVFRAAGLATHFREHYWSLSFKRVLRGLHFQLPPHACDKLVACMSGRVLDVIVDLRIDSPTFSHHYALELDGAKGEGVYLPQGIAHGFYVLSESAAVSYAVTAEYSRDFDAGILWSSIDFVWPEDSPIVSERDSSFSRLAEFSSTFRLAGP